MVNLALTYNEIDKKKTEKRAEMLLFIKVLKITIALKRSFIEGIRLHAALILL
jgi:hypothetical protein